MKPSVFIIKKNRKINEKIFNFLLQFVSKEKKERILRQFKKEDAENILIADILVKYSIKKVFGINIKNQEFNDNGKPYILNYENIHFNVSHSGDYIVCVVFNKPVGIDIQKIIDVQDCLIEKICSKEEFHNLQLSENKSSDFIKLWTQKEAALKKTGKGINGNLKDCLINTNVQSFKLDNYWLSISH